MCMYVIAKCTHKHVIMQYTYTRYLNLFYILIAGKRVSHPLPTTYTLPGHHSVAGKVLL